LKEEYLMNKNVLPGDAFNGGGEFLTEAAIRVLYTTYARNGDDFGIVELLRGEGDIKLKLLLEYNKLTLDDIPYDRELSIESNCDVEEQNFRCTLIRLRKGEIE
jgi:hypothetical protein